MHKPGNKSILSKGISSLLLLLFTLSLPAKAADSSFPLYLEKSEKPKNFSANFFYLDGFSSDLSKGSPELRAEIKTFFPDKNNNGPIAELSYQYMFGNNPAVFSGIINVDAAHMQDASVLGAYRFSLLESLGIFPYIRGRVLISDGKAYDNLYGPELGAGLVWDIYPETSSINLRYGMMFPFVHTGENSSGNCLFCSWYRNNRSYNLLTRR